MSIYDKYSVKVELIPNLPVVDYATSTKKACGVVMHATAVDGDSPEGERNYELSHFSEAFVHTFTSDTETLQVAPYEHGAFHAYAFANSHFLGNELCQTTDKNKFLLGYDRWVWLAARQLFDLGLDVIDKNTLWSHKEISENFQGNHTDPIEYLSRFSYTWDDVVKDVKNYHDQMVAEKGGKPVPTQPIGQPGRPVLQKGSNGDLVKQLQTDLNKLNAPCGTPDGIFGTKTFEAVGAFQNTHGLKPDGIVGVGTWAALDKALANLNKPEIKPSTPLNPVSEQPKPVETKPAQNPVQPPQNSVVNGEQKGVNTPPKNEAPVVSTPEENLQKAVDSIPQPVKQNLFDSIVNFLKNLFGIK